MRSIKDIVKQVFLEVHDGYSTDDVVINDELNDRFISAIQNKLITPIETFDINWTLLGLRKSGGLGKVTNKSITLENQEEFEHASEIASRIMEDKYKISSDRILCNPTLRHEFDEIARSIVPDRTNYEYRKTALKLRKTSKLRPELFNRIIETGKTTMFANVDDIMENPDSVPSLPGIYIFINHTGVLYIGEAQNLKKRVLSHLDHSDRKSLAHYFWEKGFTFIKVEIISFNKSTCVFETKFRKALEANLIISRKPRFNIQYS